MNLVSYKIFFAILTVTINTLEIRKPRTLHKVLAVFFTTYSELVDLYVNNNDGQTPEYAKIALKVRDDYFEGI